MSWQSWIQNLLAYQPINVAAIYGLDGSTWAKSDNCTATDAEVQALLAGINKDGAGSFSAFHYQGVRFMTLRLVGGSEILGKSKENCISVFKSNQCVVLGAYIGAEGKDGANEKVNVAVAKVKDALAQSGY